MDQEIERQMKELLKNVEQAEVICIIFPYFSQCLVFDGRCTNIDPPQITVAPLLGSAERRLYQLNQARPHLPKALGIVAFPWMNSITNMQGSAIWAKLMARMEVSGFDQTTSACHDVMHELYNWERRANIDMVLGRGPFYTFWSVERKKQ